MAKKSMKDLLGEIAAGEIKVAAVDTIETDMGNILDVTIWSMNVSEVLQVNIQLPDEIMDQFDFGDGGSGVQKGLARLTDYLKQKKD
jgi:hypothetical protein